MDIPLHVLRYFCVLADELHFGRAAIVLSISAPSLSQQISKLEQTVGAKLFERTPRKIELTAVGAELLPLARRVRDDHDDLLRWARSRAATEDTLLRIGVVAAGAGSLTTSILSNAMQRMPKVRLEMRRLGFFDTREELLAGTADVSFSPAPMEPDERIRTHPLWREPRVLVMRSDHRLADRSEVSIAELGDEVFLGASGGEQQGTQQTLDWWMVNPRPDGSSPRRGPTADDFEGILELVATGVGVNIASASAALHYRRDNIAFVRIADIEPTTILLCSLARPTNPAVDAFFEVAVAMTPSWSGTPEAHAAGR